MVKNKVKRQKRQRGSNLRKEKCASCHKKVVKKFHKCSGKTKEEKRKEARDLSQK